MTIHVETTTATVRYYTEGRTFENGDPYCTVATLQFIGDTGCYICGLHGVVTKELILELSLWLKNNGIRSVISHRRGKLKIYNSDRYLSILEKYENRNAKP